jgi:hypothetical protein
MQTIALRPFFILDGHSFNGLPIPTEIINYFKPREYFLPDVQTVQVASAFATSGTGITITPGISQPAISGAGATVLKALSSNGYTISSLRALLVFARRRPGTSGSIAAQTVTIRADDAAGTILGTIEIPAAAAGADIVSDLFYKEWNVTAATISAIHLVHTADTDVEFMVAMAGHDS